jgi:soluble lytic murein transglycosylase-like protein
MIKPAVLAVALCAALMASASDSNPAPALPAADTAAPGAVYVATLNNGFSIRFDHRHIMQDISRLYLTASENGYVDVATEQIVTLEEEKLPLPSAPPAVSPVLDLRSAINAASEKHLIDADLIDSVIRAESGFNPKARSPKGAQGLMQLMPGTAQRLGVQDAFDAQANIEGGTRYLRELLALYNNDLVKALAAYNAGPHRVDQYHGVPPYHETRAYVARVIRDFNSKKLGARPQPPPSKVPARKAARAAKPAAAKVPSS